MGSLKRSGGCIVLEPTCVSAGAVRLSYAVTIKGTTVSSTAPKRGGALARHPLQYAVKPAGVRSQIASLVITAGCCNRDMDGRGAEGILHRGSDPPRHRRQSARKDTPKAAAAGASPAVPGHVLCMFN